MKKTINNYLLSSAIVILIINLVINFWCLNPSFYNFEAKHHSIDKTLKMDLHSIDEVNQKITQYLKGDDDNLQMVVLIDGVEQPFFNVQELSHMQEVKNLLKRFNQFTFLSVLIGLVALINRFLMKDHDFRKLFHSFKIVIKSLFMVVLACGFLMLIDFDRFWYNIHFIFFNSQSWILDPNTSRLILLLNGQFFFNLLILILFSIIIIIALLYCIFAYLNRKEIQR